MKDKNKKANILWIMMDQCKSTALSVLWDEGRELISRRKKAELTPCLNELAGDGVCFTNAYCPSPVCGPSRACMKTGLYPPDNGVVGNWLPFKPGIRFLPELMKKGGYQTGMAGKLHFYPPDTDYGFDIRHLSDAPYSVYSDDDRHSEYIRWLREKFFDARGVDPVKLFDRDELSYDTDIKRFMLGSAFRTREEHETIWTTDRTLDFLENREKGKPFFFFTSYFGPHQPYGVPKPDSEFLKADDIRLPASYFRQREKRLPVFENHGFRLYRYLREKLSEEDCRELIAAYLCQVHMIDADIGRIIADLKRRGLYDDTMIIFTSDHGDNLGEHGLFFKEEMYDSCVKVPLLIKPVNGTSPFIRAEIVNTIDLFYTLLDAAHIKGVEQEAAGTASRSLLPLLGEEDVTWDNTTYSIVGKDRNRALSMLRENEWKLIRLANGPEKAFYEFYNLTEDPEELNDLFTCLENAEVRDRMKKKLDSWFQEQYGGYGYTALSGRT